MVGKGRNQSEASYMIV